MIINDFGPRLIDWYHKNKRDLPWRESQLPYSVWLSEIILQQTRVEQGERYFHHFKTNYPTIFDLADASEQQVLNSWQGLGYYSRARNLHKTAKIIAYEMHGIFPSSAYGLKKLPGIGPYTSAAIASICFDEEIPVVDGNVFRFLTRHFGEHTPIDTPQGYKVIQQIAETLISKNHPGNFNQAMMEFGALQCVPVKPDCAACIFHNSCGALLNNEVDILPIKARKTKVKDVYYHYLAIEFEGSLLFKKRDKKGIWENMFDFPCAERESYSPFPEQLQFEEFKFLDSLEFELSSKSFQTTHLLSHRRIHADFNLIKLNSDLFKIPSNWHWKNKKDLIHTPTPQLIVKFLTHIDKLEAL
jgi:A/G-specific adenine glycosylase